MTKNSPNLAEDYKFEKLSETQQGWGWRKERNSCSNNQTTKN